MPIVGRSGWTLAEVLVVTAILGTLTAITLPAAGAVLRVARRTACAGNLRQIGLMLHVYSEDWHGHLPAEGRYGANSPERSSAWYDRLPEYLDDSRIGNRGVFQCAGFRWSGAEHFGHASPKSLKMNAYLDADRRPRHYRRGQTRREDEVLLFVDAVAGETGMGQWGHGLASAVTDQRHRGAVNILALDGRTQSTARPPADGGWHKALVWLPAGWGGGP